jgi:hypothetical protein
MSPWESVMSVLGVSPWLATGMFHIQLIFTASGIWIDELSEA